MNSIVALPIIAATPTTAPALLSEPDPIFAVLEEWRHAEAEVDALPFGPDLPEEVMNRHGVVFRTVMRTRPTTHAAIKGAAEQSANYRFPVGRDGGELLRVVGVDKPVGSRWRGGYQS